MKQVGIVACSNPKTENDHVRLENFFDILKKNKMCPVISDRLYGGTGKDRAEALMKCYQTDGITDIFDVSGGDLANEVLPYLDYEIIKKSNKIFWGYSDLTTIINAIYAKTGKTSVLYQMMHILHKEHPVPEFDFAYQFIQGNSMKGIVVGGNIRCLLKLAGTEYWPDMKEKILFLEARSGKAAQIRTFFAQLHQLGVFAKIKGVLLGTFTELEKDEDGLLALELAKYYAGTDLPIAKTPEIGHSIHSKAIVIGKEMELMEDKGNVII